MKPIRFYKDFHEGETAVVIGNGQSLKNVDLDGLKKKYRTFGSNRVYLKPFVPDYYAIADTVMVQSCLLDIQKEDFNPDAMFLSRGVPLEGAQLVNYVVRWGFSKDIAHEIVIGGTVTFVLLQLAYYMGFTRVLLVGIDHYYPGATQGGMPGTRFIQKGKDPDHFHPDYFQEGMLYNRPELEATEKYYALAKQVYEEDNRKIINLTKGTRLDVYPKDKLKNYL